MKEPAKVDAGSLEARARRSCCGETYDVIEKKPSCTVAVGARAAEGAEVKFVVEVTVMMCSGDGKFSVWQLEKKLQLIKALESRGYELSCEEGDVSCEKKVSSGELNRELAAARKLVA